MTSLIAILDIVSQIGVHLDSSASKQIHQPMGQWHQYGQLENPTKATEMTKTIVHGSPKSLQHLRIAVDV